MATTGKSRKNCPKCLKNDKVIPLVYGEPTHEAMELEKKGELRLMGCIVYGDDPKWYCKRDRLEF
jgi:hypothetical protein